MGDKPRMFQSMHSACSCSFKGWLHCLQSESRWLVMCITIKMTSTLLEAVGGWRRFQMRPRKCHAASTSFLLLLLLPSAQHGAYDFEFDVSIHGPKEAFPQVPTSSLNERMPSTSHCSTMVTSGYMIALHLITW